MDILHFFAMRYAPHRSWQALAAPPVMGLLLALAGPFGTYITMGFWARSAHFVLCFSLIGLLIFESAYRLARRYFAGNWPLWAALVTGGGLAIPAATIVWGSLHIFNPAALSHVRFSDLIWQNLLIILVVQSGITIVAAIQNNQRLQAPPAQATETGFPLADRLPFSLKRASVLALSAEDHYLRVYTPNGEALIHMALSEAVDLFAQGFQIHRSHWVNAAYIKDYRHGSVHLTTGLSLPLSRHRKKAFEDWLASQNPA